MLIDENPDKSGINQIEGRVFFSLSSHSKKGQAMFEFTYNIAFFVKRSKDPLRLVMVIVKNHRRVWKLNLILRKK